MEHRVEHAEQTWRWRDVRERLAPEVHHSVPEVERVGGDRVEPPTGVTEGDAAERGEVLRRGGPMPAQVAPGQAGEELASPQCCRRPFQPALRVDEAVLATSH